MKAEEIEAALAAVPKHEPKPEPLPTRPIELELPRQRPPIDLEQRRAKQRHERAKAVAARRAAIDPRLHPKLRRALHANASPCMLISGPTGTGKSQALHWLMAGFGGSILHARELGSCERRHGLGEGYPPELNEARTARVLYLDDIGAEDARDLSVLQYAIEVRYRDGLATVATTGLTESELTKHLGAAYVRRLTDQHVMRGESEWPVLLVDLFGGER